MSPSGSLGVDSLFAGYVPGVDVIVDLTMEVEQGETVALLGPSGCGKTTLLRCLAGLAQPRAGRIVLGGRTLFASGEGGEISVKPAARNIGMVFQDWALFPHMTVAENVAFGVSSKGAERNREVASALDLVGIAELADRRPEDLSGGQQQRAAVARSVAQRPQLLLLDEPFSNLDATLRARVRGEISDLLAELGITTVLVTHDREEAFTLGDRVGVMTDGRIRQLGTPTELYRAPADPWVAGFVGAANLIPGRSDGTNATVLGGLELAVGSEESPAPKGNVTVLVRPEDWVVTVPDHSGAKSPDQLARSGPGLPECMTVQVKVLHSRFLGSVTELDLMADSGEVLVASTRAEVPEATTVRRSAAGSNSRDLGPAVEIRPADKQYVAWPRINRSSGPSNLPE
jgi:iron(III) transport system ATP-binding protein